MSTSVKQLHSILLAASQSAVAIEQHSIAMDDGEGGKDREEMDVLDDKLGLDDDINDRTGAVTSVIPDINFGSDDEDGDDFDSGRLGDGGGGGGDDNDDDNNNDGEKEGRKESSKKRKIIPKTNSKKSADGTSKKKKSKLENSEKLEENVKDGDSGDDEDSDDDDDDDDDDDESVDENQYQHDGFVVGSDEEESENDEEEGSSDDEENLFDKVKTGDQKKKKRLNRLQKKTDINILEDDELDLINENKLEGYDVGDFSKANRIDKRKSGYDDIDDDPLKGVDISKIRPSGGSGEDGDDYNDDDDDADLGGRAGHLGGGVDDDDDGSDLGGFLVNEGEEEEISHEQRAQMQAQQKKKRSSAGPSYEQMKEAEDIFGVGYDDFDDDDNDDFDDQGERIVKGGESAEEIVRSRMERSVLVENFCLPGDDETRRLDLPERLQEAFKNRAEVTKEEREIEATWIASKVAMKIYLEGKNSASISSLEARYKTSVLDILAFYQEKKYEVSFIWIYRRDYIDKDFTIDYLHQIVALDDKWVQLQNFKKKIHKVISTVSNAISSDDEETEGEIEQRVNEIRNLITLRTSLRTKSAISEQELNAALDLIETKEDKDEDVSPEDRERVTECQAVKEGIDNQMKETETTLNTLMQQEKIARQRKLMRSIYRPDAAAEVLRLFPEEKYLPLIDATNDELVLRDIFSYLMTLLKGAEAPSATAPDEDDMDEHGLGMDTVTEKMTSRKRVTAGKDRYKRCRKVGHLRDLVDAFSLSPAELGSAVRHGYRPNPPKNPPYSPEEEASNYIDGHVLKSSKDVLDALVTLLATEIGHEPSVKDAVRQKYRSLVTISTRPTTKGLSEITPFSAYFGLHYLEKKPFKSFLDVRNDRFLFLRLMDAEKSGLISVTLDMPVKKSYNGDAQMDLDSFLYDRHNGPELVSRYCVDKNPLATVWESLRFSVLKNALEKVLLPSLEQEARRDLVREGRDEIVASSALYFRRLVKQGPYRPQGNFREDTYELLRQAPNYPFKKTVCSIFLSDNKTDPMFMAFVDKEGMLRAYDTLPSKAMSQKRERVKKFLLDNKPEVIVLNSSGAKSSRSLQRDIQEKLVLEVQETVVNGAKERARERDARGLDEIEDDDEFFEYRPSVIIVQDKVATIFMRSTRSKKMFPDFEPGAAAAVCLARFVRDPLPEYCNLWACANAHDVFGFEALYLDLNPFQHLLQGSKRALLKALERVLVDQVSELGVDVNRCVTYDHLSMMLAFVGGLGMRKADSLTQNIRRSHPLNSRGELLSRRLIGPCVYRNSAGFLLINTLEYGGSSQGVFCIEGSDGKGLLDPFESTRIHPENYNIDEYAVKLCTDALDKEVINSAYAHIVLETINSAKSRIEAKRRMYLNWFDCWEQGRPTADMTYTETSKVKKARTHSDVVNDVRDEYENRSIENSCELDDPLSALMLDDYCKSLEEQKKGKHRLSLEFIKEELRYPALDLRQPLQPLSEKELFEIITGETDYTLHIGLKIGCVVIEVLENEVINNTDKVRHYATVKTDLGLLGRIEGPYDMHDERVDENTFRLRKELPIGTRTLAVVIGVNKRTMRLDLSIRPSHLAGGEDFWLQNRQSRDVIGMKAARWYEENGINIDQMFDKSFLEERALIEFRDAEKDAAKSIAKSSARSGQGMVGSAGGLARQIHHPLFANIRAKAAEERLRTSGAGTGDCVVRPSSHGPDSVVITWAFQENWFMHIEVEEKNKPKGSLGLGDCLVVKDLGVTEVYSDLDEIYSRFIEPMNEYTRLMIKFSKFKLGSSAEVDASMKEKLRENPNVIPYCVRFDGNRPGRFVLTCMSTDGKYAVRNHTIYVKPSGYSIDISTPVYKNRQKVFTRPRELTDWFKQYLMELMRQEAEGRRQQNAEPASRVRASRFSAPPPPQYGAPPPQQQQQYGAPPPPQMPYAGHAPPPPLYGQQQYRQ